MTLTKSSLKEKIFLKYRKDSWEIKTIEEIATEIISGSEVTRDQLGTGNHPAIKCGDINSSLPPQFEECISFVDLNLIKKPKFFEKGDVLISKMSNKTTTVGSVTTYLGEGKILLGGNVDAIKHNENPKYLGFVLSTEEVRKQIENLSKKSTVYHLYTKDIKKLQIPLPPLEIQEQIVEFLDKFVLLEGELKMELKKELEAEIENRKTQYEYYKNLIFNRGINEKKWEIKSLGEIATNVSAGEGVTRDQLDSGDYPAIKAGDVNSSLNLHFEKCCSFVDHDLIKNPKYFYKNDILFSGLGSEKTIGTVCAYLGEEKCILGECVTSMSHNQNPKYLAYVLSTEFVRKQIESLAQKSTVYVLYPSKIKQIKIPLPPLEIQNEVVEQLDKFCKIINDLKDGIPMLIKKNKEQYNFYKELLLKK